MIQYLMDESNLACFFLYVLNTGPFSWYNQGKAIETITLTEYLNLLLQGV